MPGMLVMNEMPIGAPYSLHLLSEKPREARNDGRQERGWAEEGWGEEGEVGGWRESADHVCCDSGQCRATLTRRDLVSQVF